eukprot:TRINITY_DN10329_c0_g1_i1.p1 TRINITY_DN10329_c0_g1~~TRINITY_DN10329_c0_g1_i1.p1  ORF type:complete len:849 (+),score=102.40 TRINITY_DN10329_c0_g1_i1:233-2548(+)
MENLQSEAPPSWMDWLNDFEKGFGGSEGTSEKTPWDQKTEIAAASFVKANEKTKSPLQIVSSLVHTVARQQQLIDSLTKTAKAAEQNVRALDARLELAEKTLQQTSSTFANTASNPAMPDVQSHVVTAEARLLAIQKEIRQGKEKGKQNSVKLKESWAALQKAKAGKQTCSWHWNGPDNWVDFNVQAVPVLLSERTAFQKISQFGFEEPNLYKSMPPGWSAKAGDIFLEQGFYLGATAEMNMCVVGNPIGISFVGHVAAPEYLWRNLVRFAAAMPKIKEIVPALASNVDKLSVRGNPSSSLAETKSDREIFSEHAGEVLFTQGRLKYSKFQRTMRKTTERKSPALSAQPINEIDVQAPPQGSLGKPKLERQNAQVFEKQKGIEKEVRSEFEGSIETGIKAVDADYTTANLYTRFQQITKDTGSCLAYAPSIRTGTTNETSNPKLQRITEADWSGGGSGFVQLQPWAVPCNMTCPEGKLCDFDGYSSTIQTQTTEKCWQLTVAFGAEFVVAFIAGVGLDFLPNPLVEGRVKLCFPDPDHASGWSVLDNGISFFEISFSFMSFNVVKFSLRLDTDYPTGGVAGWFVERGDQIIPQLHKQNSGPDFDPLRRSSLIKQANSRLFSAGREDLELRGFEFNDAQGFHLNWTKFGSDAMKKARELRKNASLLERRASPSIDLFGWNTDKILPSETTDLYQCGVNGHLDDSGLVNLQLKSSFFGFDLVDTTYKLVDLKSDLRDFAGNIAGDDTSARDELANSMSVGVDRMLTSLGLNTQ